MHNCFVFEVYFLIDYLICIFLSKSNSYEAVGILHHRQYIQRFGMVNLIYRRHGEGIKKNVKSQKEQTLYANGVDNFFQKRPTSMPTFRKSIKASGGNATYVANIKYPSTVIFGTMNRNTQVCYPPTSMAINGMPDISSKCQKRQKLL